MVQAASALSDIKMQEQDPTLSILGTHIVSASSIDTMQEEQLSLVSVVEKTIVEITSDVLISEKKLEEHVSLVSTVKTSPGDAINREIKQVEQLPTLYVIGTPVMQGIGDVLISEAKAGEPAVATPISQKSRSEIDSRTCFDRAMRRRMVKVRAAFGTYLASFVSVIYVAKARSVSAPISEITRKEKPSSILVLEAPPVNTTSDALIYGIKLEEQLPLVPVLEEHIPVVGTPISLANSSAIDSQTRFDRATHAVSTPSSGIRLEEQYPVVSIVETPTMQISTGDTLINEIKLVEQFPFASVDKIPNVQLTSTLNSKARLEAQSPVETFVETPPVHVTNSPISETPLQERLFTMLKNLPPPSQLPRFTAAEIQATAVRFEQAITSLVTLSIKIAETKGFFAAGGTVRAASVVRHSPPKSALSLRHSIFTHTDVDESEYEDNVENNCSAPVRLAVHDSESESEHSDIEGVNSFPKVESKRARILRERREALAASLTDDMLFNLLLVDCTTKPKLPDKTPIIIRKWKSRVPIDREPRYIGKYRVQWW
ncbi:hypothetical protein BGX38DRAFT_1169894 [Terfezia claveryi]|nr:hypothetical protein BGX38DRAFT_1169894 [Terfezia claveryi]